MTVYASVIDMIGETPVVDVSQLSPNPRVRILAKIGSSARMSGQGVVIEQSPAAGEPLGTGEVGVLKLGRQLPLPAVGGAPQ